METFKKKDHVLENPRQYTGESEKLGDWEVSREWRYKGLSPVFTYERRCWFDFIIASGCRIENVPLLGLAALFLSLWAASSSAVSHLSKGTITFPLRRGLQLHFRKLQSLMVRWITLTQGPYRRLWYLGSSLRCDH